MKLAGRGIIITGSSQGLGREIARQAIIEGASVVLSARNRELLEQTRQELSGIARDGQHVFAAEADVSRPDEVGRLFQFAVERLPSLTGLVNNAGVYGPKGAVGNVDWDEWRTAVEVNLFGTVLPCSIGVPLFRKSGYGKIVNLSGGGATAPLPFLSAYAASKAAVVRFTETLAEETRDAGIDVNALAPGALNTKMLDEILAAGPEKVGAKYYEKAVKQKREGGASLDRAAALCMFLLSAESDGITGRLISAVWDRWEELPGRKSALSATDVYTLRRIVARDRGLDWD